MKINLRRSWQILKFLVFLASEIVRIIRVAEAKWPSKARESLEHRDHRREYRRRYADRHISRLLRRVLRREPSPEAVETVRELGVLAAQPHKWPRARADVPDILGDY